MIISKTFKYIIVIDKTGGEMPILFPDYLEHITFDNIFVIVAAGFADIGIDKEEISVSTFGESSSLKLKSRTIDTKLILGMITRKI